MNFQEELHLERYKVVTDRQKYFTELAKETFNLYIKAFVYIITGAVALISLKEKFSIPVEILLRLLSVLLLLIWLLGISAILQITFCLIKWYGLSNEERQITKVDRSVWWAFIYEGIYIAVIGSSLFIMETYRPELSNLVRVMFTE